MLYLRKVGTGELQLVGNAVDGLGVYIVHSEHCHVTQQVYGSYIYPLDRQSEPLLNIGNKLLAPLWLYQLYTVVLHQLARLHLQPVLAHPYGKHHYGIGKQKLYNIHGGT